MKKILYTIIVVFFATISITPFAKANTLTPVEIAQQAGYSVDGRFQPVGYVGISHTGQVLYDYEGQQQWDPASMTKLMTMYLTLKAIDEGKFKLTDTVKITDDHYRMSTLPELSNTKLYPGETYTVAELLQITVSASSNASSLILANLVSDNTSDFVDLMNHTAKDFGMNDTHYVNPTGAENRLLQDYAPERYRSKSATVSSPHDYAILAQRAVNDTPKILTFTKQVAPTQHGVTYYTFNNLLEGADMSVPGTDGLKTGSSDVADYNSTVTTKRDQFRIHSVIMGVGDYYRIGGEEQRDMINASMINYLFNQYEYRQILTKGEHEINGTKYYVTKDLYDVVPKNMNTDYKFVVKDGKVHIDYDRTFITSSYSPPTVKVERPLIHTSKSIAESSWSAHPVLTLFGLFFLVLLLSIPIYYVLLRFRK
ncbi:DUF1958 domain-containing protein [Staphylococcus muscae]|uniref:D-alanyl-D-alanine carboxypeptidase n=1 Tax=Staphylococcus muscae TaxID=1294 RepID=A0A240BV55_9STAP|nr:penicillin-binding protein PBP4 [Staphylococcus muscae]AVQ34229.1 DUF1958 domain-containing protein [Staphylococcus muscae]PNZ05780.1 DUF1958 domain-containing protein [Staphylococcus muscae]GGA85015.1 D-alanyl-D-alanine carboxypeptidase [Staphylococcus muscae]SNV99585.1 penicillin binding protein 4 [Staphylococcus muscae]